LLKKRIVEEMFFLMLFSRSFADEKCILDVRQKKILNTKVLLKKVFSSHHCSYSSFKTSQRKESLQEIKSGCGVPMRYVLMVDAHHIE
jgi:hypothetical protein